MAKKFRPFAYIAFRHTYFNSSGGFCRDLELMPMAATQSLFRRYDLRLHNDGDGFGLYYGQESPRQAPVLSIPDTLRLAFLIKVKNPYFINYTELPLQPKGDTIYYFNNLQPKASGEAAVLNQGPFVGFHGPELVKKTTKVFPYRATPNGTEVNLAINDPLGPLGLNEGTPVIAKDPEAASLFRVNLGEFPSGYFEIRENKNTDNAFRFFTDDREVGNDIFGVLDLFIGQNGLSLGKDGEQEIPPARYELLFDARHTFWRYLVFNTNDHPLGDMSINSNNGLIFRKIAPEGDQEPAFPGPQKTAVFVCDKPIAMEEQSSHAFTLKFSGSGNDKEIRLPSPGYQTIKPEFEPESNDRKIYSDMYVYL